MRYSPEMLEAWEKTRKAYERLLTTGDVRPWRGYTSRDRCLLCIASGYDPETMNGEDCRICVLADNVRPDYADPCVDDDDECTIYLLWHHVWTAKTNGDKYASAELLEAAAARYDWLCRRAHQNLVASGQYGLEV